jgi:hypothetical protein
LNKNFKLKNDRSKVARSPLARPLAQLKAFFMTDRSAARSAQGFFTVDRSSARSAHHFFCENRNPACKRARLDGEVDKNRPRDEELFMRVEIKEDF